MAGAGASVEFDVDDLMRLLTESPDDIIRAVSQEVHDIGLEAFDQSQEMVPWRTGTLKGSGSIEVTNDAAGVTVELSYGGPAAEYAIYVHEIQNNYNYGKSWKYLEQPVSAKVPEIHRRVQTVLNDALGRYGT